MTIDQFLSSFSFEEVRIENFQEEVRGLTFDSRRVQPGYVFFALPGSNTDGHFYIQEAVERGAILVVLEKKEFAPSKGSWVLVSEGRRALALASSFFYDDPSSALRIMGVTGTNGKTTTCFFLRSIWEGSGFPCGLLTTARNIIGPWEEEAVNTTEESLSFCRHLYQMRKMSIKDAVVEVSSHALALGRVEGVKFDSALVTNLISEHMEFHRSFEHYFASKKKLLQMVEENLVKNHPRVVAVNGDDEGCLRMIKSIGVPFLTYGLNREAEVRGEEINYSLRHSSFLVRSPWGKMEIVIHFPGVHNVYNALAAISLALFYGLDTSSIQESLFRIRHVPGRWEFVEAGQDFTVIVDFAHNWHGLEKSLSIIRELTPGKVITVFGCGGERDRGKRPFIGETVARFSDVCIVTTDNPRGEAPEQTALDALEGVKKVASNKKLFFEVILDRADAIRRALELAQKEDTVFLAGKGPERFQVYKGKIVPHNDHYVAWKLLKEKENEIFTAGNSRNYSS
ncbi:MAG TPA: UDP-N-acetylmuramoyl-L-alanyl-D-glutamate--2,6-diaminopimelate ligase [Candidatus Atribacteria bacterium]|nr:UDP-N-acetylmuramoyl-L-alanyl-D-glutamate--2,6-diaminopimelate ligase [Candidatus Atribacteria bacterium]